MSPSAASSIARRIALSRSVTRSCCEPRMPASINRLPKRKGAGRGGEGVLDVDVTDERQLDVGRATRRNQLPLAAPGSESDGLGANVGHFMLAEAQRPRWQPQGRPLFRICVDNGRAVGLEILEQESLRFQVALHGAVIVEMITGEIGECDDVELQS